MAKRKVAIVLTQAEARAVLSMVGLIEASDEWWESVPTQEAKAGERAIHKLRAANRAAQPDQGD